MRTTRIQNNVSLPLDETTDFGFQQVEKSKKSSLVADIFHSVAHKYDLMNDVMSLGIHRLWKQKTMAIAAARPGMKVLDLAGGTGDLAKQFAPIVGTQGEVVLADINESMLKVGRNKLRDQGILKPVSYCQVDAENLPFQSNYFDIITIAFGLRNVTDKSKALDDMYRILKPGGKLLILEFSKPTNTMMEKLYHQYSFQILPKLGEHIAQDKASYQYLAESIKMHPGQDQLKEMIECSGFAEVDYINMTQGVVALHRGFKF
jgi:demethylmenaquinone methyltransferase / 2-methoxy-6-polyprenyl-1,4-benzoquinol methylase